MPGRTFSSNAYRYGFQGQEKDDEVSGSGNSNTAAYWQYDTRLGRRWNVDPVIKPWESPYACFSNNPIFYNDPKGLTAGDPTKKAARQEKRAARKGARKGTAAGRVNDDDNCNKKGDWFRTDDGNMYQNSVDAIVINSKKSIFKGQLKAAGQFIWGNMKKFGMAVTNFNVHYSGRKGNIQGDGAVFSESNDRKNPWYTFTY
jgi:RHS repeat-associated protein